MHVPRHRETFFWHSYRLLVFVYTVRFPRVPPLHVQSTIPRHELLRKNRVLEKKGSFSEAKFLSSADRHRDCDEIDT